MKLETDTTPELYIADFDNIAAGDSNFLGDPEVVDAIIRTFLLSAIEARDAYHANLPSAPPDLEKWLAENSAAKARIFLGLGNDYIAQSPEWNSADGGIVNNVRRRYDLKADDPEKILSAPFYAVVQGYLDAEAEAKEGRDWEHLIDGAIELATATLMGTDELAFPFEQ